MTNGEHGRSAQVFREAFELFSGSLQRNVWFDVYWPAAADANGFSLLLLHDGQDLQQTLFYQNFTSMNRAGLLKPLLIAAVHAGPDRLMEYGTADVPDYAGRGGQSAQYHRFLLEELIPFLRKTFKLSTFPQQAVAGFSLGGLSAISIAWQHPQAFSIAGVFSGSLWWRSKALDAGYEEDRDRIMHQLIRNSQYKPGLRFYFTTGSLDETADRNGNGIIDSIDDTVALIEELESKGYRQGKDIFYHNYEDGRHDVATWVRTLPHFLLWGWGKKSL